MSDEIDLSFLNDMPDDMFPPSVKLSENPDDKLPPNILPVPFDVPGHLVGEDREQYIIACYYLDIMKVKYNSAVQGFNHAQELLVQNKQNMDSLYSDLWEAAHLVRQKGKRRAREE